MKIQVGIGTKEELDFFPGAGADELYCGSSPAPGHLYGGETFGSFRDIAGAVELAHRRGKILSSGLWIIDNWGVVSMGGR